MRTKVIAERQQGTMDEVEGRRDDLQGAVAALGAKAVQLANRSIDDRVQRLGGCDDAAAEVRVLSPSRRANRYRALAGGAAAWLIVQDSHRRWYCRGWHAKAPDFVFDPQKGPGRLMDVFVMTLEFIGH
jgi:hypothetical protein